ncbi:tetratricopeptide repeat protein [Streptomyces sp. NA04227]|uniref:tetratricopeptide repeat protein n=1 Tax=Streptomyces sp. NA04227 TaxID=2742136 RepID=UPI0015911351|nr:tetratricopeptide repeat protein [Streptomyces sp. NA04227]QKW08078.1 tetratricopeptide repeat protein [Streptomyces sp. NA04227]
MAGRRPSRQDINRRRGQAGFVGRRSELAVFRETLVRDPEETDFPFLFHVHGNGGVGKSTLLRQWETAARERPSVVTALVDDEVHDPLEAMEALSARLGQQGCPLKKFDKQLSLYRQRRHQADSAQPVTPAGTGESGAGEEGAAPASTSGTVMAQLGLVGLGAVPVVGAFAGAVDPQQVAQGVDRVRSMLNARLRSHEDVQLVMRPVEMLTPVFLEDLGDVAERCERVVLFFDVYERTGPVLDDWLREITFGEVLGSLPVNVQIVLAGRSRPHPRSWGDWLGAVTEVALDVFTEEEARTLLAARGVVDESSIELILRLSGRLPLLVDMLAQSDTRTGDGLDDVSETAVERFLKWESNEQRREAALACALPSYLDEDIYRAVVPPETSEDYAWLRALAFVSRQDGRCRYHDVVRTAMLRLRRTQSPARWEEQHLRLAETFRARRQSAEVALGSDEFAHWDDASWREHRLNETYHRLCVQPARALPDALAQTIRAVDHDITTLHRWAQLLTRAGRDADHPPLTAWGERLTAVTEASEARGAAESAEGDTAPVAALTLLLGAAELTTPTRALAHAVRARENRLAGSYAEALADYAVARRLDPELKRVHEGRGETLRLLGRNEEALVEFDRAIEFDPQNVWAIASRAETYQGMGRHEEALADFTRVVELDPRNVWVLLRRGLSCRSLGRYEEALTDFTSALELDPSSASALAFRGDTHQAAGRYDDALTDLTRAVELDPEYEWPLAMRGEIHRLMGRYDEASTDFGRALELDPEDDWVLTSRGEVHQSLGRYEDALADFTRALEFDPNYAWAAASRGQTHTSMGRYEDASADYTRAVELRPGTAWFWAGRAEARLLLGDGPAALEDCRRALDIDPEDGELHLLHALATRSTGDDEATARFEQARSALTAVSDGAWADRGKARRAAGFLVVLHCATAEWDSAAERLDAFLDAEPPFEQLRDLVEMIDLVARVAPETRAGTVPLRERVRENLISRT